MGALRFASGRVIERWGFADSAGILQQLMARPGLSHKTAMSPYPGRRLSVIIAGTP